uniref:BTAD domain-containing putative transcriptional regulator n=1 Tax=Streptomyces albogriseolus TaxID=1887 RepID=UPI002B1CC239|nr:BTAD domain-containing putative transcriptional regulator [Streptomyces viridodiastaticus]
MGRKEKPIAASNRALVKLACWLRDQRSASGCSYAELADRAGCHATTLQRAASGRSVPSARIVRAYAAACGASENKAMELWRQARRRKARSASVDSPLDIDGIDMFRAGLRELYETAGRPSMRDMERAGGPGQLPHSTAHRIVLGQTVPRDVHQLTGFLKACSVAEDEHSLWVDAWRRALGQQKALSPASRKMGFTAHRPVQPINATSDLAPAAGSYFALLGPVRAWRDGEPVSTGSPQQRALLAALLLREGRTATAPELIDALWGEEPPSQALAAVRTYASRLRKVLDPGVLVSESGGYAVRGLGEGALDLAAAQELAAEAEKARNTGDLCHARDVLTRALSLWDGETLAGVPGPYAETQRVRLEEWRLQLLESRLDMDLEQGCHAEAVSELTALTAAHPLRERLRELLMLALYRSGRQAEALAVYADTRRLLGDELGVDPRPGLQDLQQRILQADPGLTEPSAPMAEPVTAPVRPAQLPATVPDFTGRASFVRELSDVLASASGAEGRVMALAGIGGVGKTTLAVHVAHGARSAFPDGQLYVDLQGAGARSAEPETVLGSFLRALGTADSAIPDLLEERAALYRSMLNGRRVLVVLDNARSAAQVRPLLPGTGGCAALVTSRVRMVDLAGARLLNLDELSPQEALSLFTRIVGEDRVASEREAALGVVAACGFLPLAIRIAASRLAARRTWTVSVLADKLADEQCRLDELAVGDLAVESVLEFSYSQLETEQARAFCLLSGATLPFISLPEAASFLNRGLPETGNLLESLVDAGLLISMGSEYYQVHSLARLFGAARSKFWRLRQEPSPS